jgi:hypothetical protein
MGILTSVHVVLACPSCHLTAKLDQRADFVRHCCWHFSSCLVESCHIFSSHPKLLLISLIFTSSLRYYSKASLPQTITNRFPVSITNSLTQFFYNISTNNQVPPQRATFPLQFRQNGCRRILRKSPTEAPNQLPHTHEVDPLTSSNSRLKPSSAPSATA